MRTLDTTLKDLFSLYDDRREAIIADYFRFLSFASVSTEAEHKPDILACVKWLSDFVKTSGFEAEVWDTPVHPVIFASWMKAGPDQPTVLIYNHYDVQPVDPLDLWKSPPFEPTVRDGEVFARGAGDNKGQCFYVLSALKALLERDGKLPVNVKLIIEGEEEAGSQGLTAILETKKQQLKADQLLVVDLALHEPNVPQVCLGLRGIAPMTIELVGSNSDLHSGGHGGIAYNPNHALVELLAKLRDAEGRVTVPGFYDDVAPLTKEERSQVSFEFDAERYRKAFAAEPHGGEKNYDPAESVSIRPTLEINGIGGGYTGSGFKTVIPAKAVAKISCRLVPHQDPVKIGMLVENFLRANTPTGLQLSVEQHHGGRALRTDPKALGVLAAAQAFSEVLKRPCRFFYEGGSIPVITELAKTSAAEVALFGYGLPTDNWHAPNEHFGLDRMRNGFVTISRILQILGERN